MLHNTFKRWLRESFRVLAFMGWVDGEGCGVFLASAMRKRSKVDRFSRSLILLMNAVRSSIVCRPVEIMILRNVLQSSAQQTQSSVARTDACRRSPCRSASSPKAPPEEYSKTLVSGPPGGRGSACQLEGVFLKFEQNFISSGILPDFDCHTSARPESRT
jgi:hypothetical protein